MEDNDLCIRLAQAATGANVHTINKAIHYLNYWDKDNTTWKITKPNEIARNKLAKLCEIALQNGDWKEVQMYLKKCW